MGTPYISRRAKLITAIFFSDRTALNIAASELEALFGKVDYKGEEFDFDATEYYRREMGTPITKSIWSFEKLINKENLASIKSLTNEIEKKLPSSSSGGRLVNIDAGYLTEAKLVLATTKNFSHRIYLSQGIFAEITLMYNKKTHSYESLPWTYPDYKTQRVLGDLKKIRTILRTNLS